MAYTRASGPRSIGAGEAGRNPSERASRQGRPSPDGYARTEGGNSVVPGVGGESAAIIDGADFTGITDDSDSGETS
jgi:hypothetical protein